MDPFTTPHDEMLLSSVRPEDETQKQMILRLIKQNGENIERYKMGERYYYNDPDIKHEKAPKDAYGRVDHNKPDWRLTHGLHSNLVDQKIGYLLSDPVSFKHQKEALTQSIDDLLGFEFDDELNDVLTAASNKGIEWLHVYVNEDSEFKFMQIPAEQIIPIYADRKEKVLQSVIRYYTVNKEQRVEYWTADEVTYYIMTDNNLEYGWYHGMDEGNPTTHLQGESWGRVPFIPFKNNSDSEGDLWRYKPILDAMNKRLSDMQNMFDESTELIYVLKEYEGQDLAEFMENLKYYKAINVAGEGGVETIQVEVPVDSSIAYLNELRSYVYDYGRGVDFNRNELGNSPSGIALKFLYTNLDLKAKQLARKTIPAIKELVWFAFESENMAGDQADEIEVTFNYNRMVNELEQSNIAGQSKGIISDDTIIANHPWVDDLEGEKERLNEQDRTYGTELPIGGSEDE